MHYEQSIVAVQCQTIALGYAWTSCPHKGCYAWTFGQYARKMPNVRPLFQALHVCDHYLIRKIENVRACVYYCLVYSIGIIVQEHAYVCASIRVHLCTGFIIIEIDGMSLGDHRVRSLMMKEGHGQTN